MLLSSRPPAPCYTPCNCRHRRRRHRRSDRLLYPLPRLLNGVMPLLMQSRTAIAHQGRNCLGDHGQGRVQSKLHGSLATVNTGVFKSISDPKSSSKRTGWTHASAAVGLAGGSGFRSDLTKSFAVVSEKIVSPWTVLAMFANLDSTPCASIGRGIQYVLPSSPSPRAWHLQTGTECNHTGEHKW